jgi:UDP-apiose/xylose synthase
MRVLSLGAAGFIGSHLTDRLLREGHSVVAVDLYTDKIRELECEERLTIVEQDIRAEGWRLDALVRDADVVIDLVAYANPGLYVRMPLEVFRLNFSENLKIAETCVREEKRLIQFSTCEVYGRTVATIPSAQVADPEDPIHATFSEDASEFILGPVNRHRWIYASAKQLLERVLHAYGIEQGFNYTIVRPFNFIGPKIDFLPSDREGIPRVFSFFMDALLTGSPMQLVDGGSHRRCYTFIDDAVEAIYRMVLNPGGVCDRQIFNVGSPGNEISIRQMAMLMRDIYAELEPGATLPPISTVPSERFYGEGYDDSDRRIPDITKARTLLGWTPRWGLRDMFEVTMRYYITQYGASRRGQVPLEPA